MAEHLEQQSNDSSSAEPQSQTERQRAGQQASQPQVGQVPTNRQTRQQSVASPSTFSPLRRIGKVAAVITLALCLFVGWLLWWYSFPWYVFVSLPALLLIIGVGYIFKWSWVGVVEYPGPSHARSKTLWDWLQLLIIPVILAGGGYLFGTWQHDTDQQRALDQQQAAILQTYIDNIQDLLLNHNLLKSKPDKDAVAILARARTLTALHGLDPERKGRLLIFLYEAQLIGFQDNTSKAYEAIIGLSGADLTNAALGDTDLSSVNLQGADLYGAALYRANLSSANLQGADLRYANLQGADLSCTKPDGGKIVCANLQGADLTGADLSCAKPDGGKIVCANLRGAQGLTQPQLDQVSSCKSAMLPMLPPGLKCKHN